MKIELPPTKPDLENVLEIALATGSETGRFDFKETLNLKIIKHRIRLIKAIVAFGNSEEGGYLIIGISDDLERVGISEEIKKQFDQSAVFRKVEPYVSPVPDFLVRHHHSYGLDFIVIEVNGFESIPSVVIQGLEDGKEKIVTGSFVIRGRGAESRVARSETDVRTICNRIVKNRANEILDMMRKAQSGIPPVSEINDRRAEQLTEARLLANESWPSDLSAAPYIEVGFAIEDEKLLTIHELRKIFPGACVPIQHGFPFNHVYDAKVYDSTSWGWRGIIPHPEEKGDSEPASYTWVIVNNRTFVDREHYWEDKDGSVIPGGVGVYHIVGRLILLILYLERYSKMLDVDPSRKVLIGMKLNNVQNRYLANEKEHWDPRIGKDHTPTDMVVEISKIQSLSTAISNSTSLCLDILEEIGWKFRQHKWDRAFYRRIIETAPNHLGTIYKLE